MSQHKKPLAVFFLQLGTPSSASLSGVGIFLIRFLNDRRVIDIFWFFRLILVNLIIIPLRLWRVTQAYRSIQDKEGRLPLEKWSSSLAQKVQNLSPDHKVLWASTYDPRDLEKKIQDLQKTNLYQDWVILPFFPQYAASSNAASLSAFFNALDKQWDWPNLRVKRSFYDDPGFIQSIAQKILATKGAVESELFVFSFHGLPVRHLTKSGCSGVQSCQQAICPKDERVLQSCYKAQAHQTARCIMEALKLSSDKPYEVVFQSRLGSTPWIDPDLEVAAEEWKQKGIRSLTLVAPSFTADCLETVEELGERFQEQWCHDGSSLCLVSCLNDDELWAQTLAQWIEKIAHQEDTIEALDLEDRFLKPKIPHKIAVKKKQDKEKLPPESLE